MFVATAPLRVSIVAGAAAAPVGSGKLGVTRLIVVVRG